MIWRGGFNKLTRWSETVEKIGVPGPHFHDLRHSGNTLAARNGASTRELTGNTLASRAPGASLRDLMARMGHDSPRAALIYPPTNSEADRGIADALSEAVNEHHRKALRDSDELPAKD
jgi:integrase